MIRCICLQVGFALFCLCAMFAQGVRPVHNLSIPYSALPKSSTVSGIVYVYPDSDSIGADAVRIVSGDIVLTCDGMYERQISPGAKIERDIFLVHGDSIIDLRSKIRNNRRGQMDYLCADSTRLVISFDVYRIDIDSQIIYSDVPRYDRVFDHSELWVVYLDNYQMKKLDVSEYGYQDVRILNNKLIVNQNNEYVLYMNRRD